MNYNFYSFVLLVSVFTYFSCDNDTPPTQATDRSAVEEPATQQDMVVCENSQTPIFVETDSMIIVEAENADYAKATWTYDEKLDDFSGEGYLVWKGKDSFGQPGNGLLTYIVRVSTPGTYNFVWRSRITEGTSTTDFNDSWLRIPDAKHFYGKRKDGHIVYPNDSELDTIPESAGQESTKPEGSSKDGWFKIYMNTASKWHWGSYTSDNNPHAIFVIFPTAGDYTIEISARSKGHGIDKFVLFHEKVQQSTATASTAKASKILCE